VAPAPFGNRLLDLQIEADGGLDVALGDEQDVVDDAADDPRGSRARLLDGDPFRDRVARRRQLFAADPAVHRRVELGLHAHDRDVGAQRLGCGADAGDQPTAADGHDEGVDVRRVGEHLERDGALAGDDLGIVERMDEGQAPLLREAQRLAIGLVEHLAVEDDAGAVALRLHHLDARGGRRHDDGDRHAKPAAMVGERLGMVAGGRRDHAAGAHLLRHQQQLVERSALLVGGGELEVLELHIDGGAGGFGKGAAEQGRRPDHRALDTRRRRVDVGEGDGNYFI
jgi:hypothetical protein